jgi:CubicO group peptidase (beta-lactamase class C family)
VVSGFRQIFLRLAFSAALLVAAAVGQGADRAELLGIVEARAEGGRFMGCVLVAAGDRVEFEACVGLANAEWSVPHTRDSKFRIGSLTKQFTAAAILLLEQRGQLATGDRLAKFIPDVPAGWQAITVQQLLNHTSGIPDFTQLPPAAARLPEGASPSQLTAALRDLPLEFKPGTRFSYSNSNYVLLGWIVELVSGQSYRRFLAEEVLAPLGLADTGYDSAVAVIPHRAAGYVTGALGQRNAAHVDMRTPHGAGGLYSTAPDLLKWTRGLFGHRLLSRETVAKMTTPSGVGTYACGLNVQRYRGRLRYSHAGGIAGFSSWLSYYPESDVTIVVLANVEGPVAPELAEAIEHAWFGDAP